MKGQWFLISAVVAVGAFLSISVFFRDYFAVDSSSTARINEEMYFSELNEQFDTVVQQSGCADMDSNLKEFESFSAKKMSEIGYFLYMNHEIKNCASKIVTKQIVLASDRAVLNEGIDAESVLRR